MSLIDYYPRVLQPKTEFQSSAIADIQDINETTPDFEIENNAAEQQLGNLLNAYDTFQKEKELHTDSPGIEKDLRTDIYVSTLSFVQTIMPPAKVEELDLPVATTTRPERPASLSDAYLLARAYDATGNDAIKLSLEYVLYDAEPELRWYLIDAYSKSRQNGTTIMDEHRKIDLAISSALAALQNEAF